MKTLHYLKYLCEYFSNISELRYCIREKSIYYLNRLI